MKANKASQTYYIPKKFVTGKSDIFSDFLCISVNSSLKSSKFPIFLKPANITPLHKKDKRDQKRKFRPVSILLKIYKRCVTITFLTKYFLNINVGFRRDLAHSSIF